MCNAVVRPIWEGDHSATARVSFSLIGDGSTKSAFTSNRPLNARTWCFRKNLLLISSGSIGTCKRLLELGFLKAKGNRLIVYPILRFQPILITFSFRNFVFLPFSTLFIRVQLNCLVCATRFK